MKPRAIVFLDIDGTLLTPAYTANSTRVRHLLRRLERRGIVCGLNSNRSMHDLLPVVRQFGISGPVIAENGAFWFRKKTLHPLTSLRPLARLDAILARLAGKNVYCVRADTVTYPWKDLRHTPRAWIVNAYRKWTASIHVRSYGTHDVRAAHGLALRLRHALGSRYRVDVSPIFSNVLVTPRALDKGGALRRLRLSSFPTASIAMIGDELGDSAAVRTIGTFFTVANAPIAVRRRAAYASRFSYTKGVADILGRLLNEKLFLVGPA